MSTMYNLLHIPLCTVMLILIFNSTAYCHAHSFTFYILFFISYFSFILSYVYFPCVVFSIFALSMERTRLSFHCWLYSLCIVVYVTNKTWNLKLDSWSHNQELFKVIIYPKPKILSSFTHTRYSKPVWLLFSCGCFWEMSHNKCVLSKQWNSTIINVFGVQYSSKYSLLISAEESMERHESQYRCISIN